MKIKTKSIVILTTDPESLPRIVISRQHYATGTMYELRVGDRPSTLHYAFEIKGYENKKSPPGFRKDENS